MNSLKRFTIAGVLFTLVVGTLLHFTYEWSDRNMLVGLISAVNESVWEHMKLVFFPMLLYSFYMNRKLKKEYPCILSALNFGILLGTLCIPVLFYTYSGILGYNTFILDIGTFIGSVLTAFYAVYKLAASCRLQRFSIPLRLAVLFLAVCFAVFTFAPGVFIPHDSSLSHRYALRRI